MISLTFLKNHRIAIFGTGFDAAKCMYELQQRQIIVENFFNNHCQITSFCGRPVYEPSAENMKGIFIIIATAEKTFLAISEQLRNMELREFEDFIFYPLIDRKMVLLHGNCHMSIVKEYLESCEYFNKEYYIYYNPLICNNIEHKIRKEVLKNCDVWIHEDIQENNAYGIYLSDKYIRQIINSKVLDITIPHLYGLGKAFFPQVEYNKNNPPLSNGVNTNGMFPHADIVIDKCKKKGMNVEQICKFVQGNNAIDEKYIMTNFNMYMKKIKEREVCWDIKIYDFIVNHYRKEKLFFDIGHPTNTIIKEISIRILEKLNISNINIVAKSQMDACETPIYPCVQKCLSMQWKDIELRKSRVGRLTEHMDFTEYVKEYIWWCYGYEI